VTEAILDTDILSELLRGRNARVVARAKDYVTQLGPFAVSVVTLMELAKGLEKAGRPGDLDLILARWVAGQR
jgi:tRNA(fMet)-specific endonuclease VapC